MVSYETLGSAIRDARERAGLTQEELGRRIGVSRPTISLLENAVTRHPRMDHILAIEHVLELAPGTLFDAAGLKMPESAGAQVNWLAQQLDERNRRVLVELAFVLLKVQQDQAQKGPRSTGRPARSGA